MRADLHIHSKYSKDCRLEPRDILKASAGLDAIAITDHDTIRGGLETRRLAKAEGIDIEIIVGAEIKTYRGEVLGYGIEEEIAAREFWQVVDSIKEQGGIVGLSHPFDTIRPHSFRPSEDIVQAIDVVEVFNSRCAFASFNEKALRFAREHNLGMTAGSDAHTIGEIGRAGVILDSIDLRPDDLKDVSFFGDKTSIFELLKTKVNKLIQP